MNTTLETSKQIRKAKRSEIDEIIGIANNTFDTFYRPFLGDHNVSWYLNNSELKREIVKHFSDLHVLILNEKVAGFIIYFENFIHIMMIDLNIHHAGLGSYMLKKVEKELFKKS